MAKLLDRLPKTYKELSYAVGKKKREHVLIVEKALGSPLPKGAEVHHVDDNIHNNEPSNLVLCPNRAYHALLHKRARALEACGNADWCKCPFCKQYDDPENLVKHGTKNMLVHAQCRQAYDKARGKLRYQKVKDGSSGI